MPNYIFGRNTVNIAINSKKILVNKIFTNESTYDLYKNLHPNVEVVEKSFLDELSESASNQGVAADVSSYQYVGLTDIIEKSNKSESYKIAILDQVKDARNLGAIIRSAYAFGVDAMIIMDKRQALVNEFTHKTSAGASLLMDIVKVPNLNNTIKKLKENEFWIYSTDLKAKTTLKNIDFDKKSCVVIGSEDKGTSQLILKNSDFTFKIDMPREFDSLNASVAASIVFYKLNDQ